MEDAMVTQMRKEMNHLQDENRRLEKRLEFYKNYIDMDAKVKAVEYIVRSR